MPSRRHATEREFACSCHCRRARTETEAVDVRFGAFLVERRAIDRHQLLQGLQMQDNNPGFRLGECLVALGLMVSTEIEAYLGSWRSLVAGI